MEAGRQDARTSLTEACRALSFYTIAFSPRCGSNLLCEYLASCGIGYPFEYFQWPYATKQKYLLDEFRISERDTAGFFCGLIKSRAVGGIFGSKLAWDHKNVLIAEANRAFGGIERIEDIFPRNVWIYMRRRDRIAQAVSLWRAAKTNVWTSKDPPASGHVRLEYDYFKILQFLSTLLIEEYLWTEFFREQSSPPCEIWYEELTADPEGAVRRVVEALVSAGGPAAGALPPVLPPLKSELSRQSDGQSAAIKERFINDLGQIGVTEYWRDREDQGQRWSEFFDKELWKAAA